MKHFIVSWLIDIEDADTPKEAAQQALKLLRDPDSTTVFFTVTDQATGQMVDVDLLEEEPGEVTADALERMPVMTRVQ